MQSLCTLRDHCRQRSRNTRYRAGAAPYSGRSSTGWIAPACLAHSFDDPPTLARTDRGIGPSVSAVFKLTTSSNRIGCSTARPAGSAPLRILPARDTIMSTLRPMRSATSPGTDYSGPRPAVFDRYVVSLDAAGVADALAKSGQVCCSCCAGWPWDAGRAEERSHARRLWRAQHHQRHRCRGTDPSDLHLLILSPAGSRLRVHAAWPVDAIEYVETRMATARQIKAE